MNSGGLTWQRYLLERADPEVMRFFLIVLVRDYKHLNKDARPGNEEERGERGTPLRLIKYA